MDLVEREQELRLLEDCLQRVAGGTGHMVLLGGEAGIGKSSLLQSLAERRHEANLWWGACDALQTPHPLAPLQDIARSSEVGFRPLLAEGGSRAALFEAVLTELQRSRRPTLVVIEDVHWADDATLDLLKFLGRRIDRVPCLLVISFRDDQLTTTHPLRRVIGDLPKGTVTRIDLPRLSPPGVDLLARRALRSPDGIHATTHGNPFFVTELLRHGGKDVPRAVQDLVLARYAELDADAQAIVRLVSVVPAKIERWLVEQLLGTAVAPLEACLNSGLLTTIESSALAFRHELARVAIESSLSEPVARSLHAEVLKALKNKSQSSASLARLVHHASRAGDQAAVLRYAPEAARQAEQRGAHREAAAHYGTAMHHAESAGEAEDVERTAGWLEAWARGCERTDQLDEFIAVRLRLDASHRRSGNVAGEAQNLSRLAMAYALKLRNPDADAASRKAIDLLETLPPCAALANAYQVQAHLRMLSRENDTSIQRSRQAIELAERLGEHEIAAAAMSTLGAATMFSNYDAGCAQLLRALDMALANGYLFVAANAYINLCTGSCELFRLDAAKRYLNQAVAFADKHEYDMYRSYFVTWLAVCEVALGEWDAGATRASEIVRRGAWQTNRVAALIALGRVRARRGDPGAMEAFDEALTLALASGSLRHIAPVRAARAEAAYLRGDASAVVEEAKDALELAVKHGHAWFSGELAYWMHRVDASTGAPVPCAEPFALQIDGQWAEAAAAWAALGCTYEHARALAEGDGDAPLLAWKQFVEMGARPAADALHQELRKAGRRDLPRVARPATQANPFQLTAREIEVLSLLCKGLKNSAIAEHLVRSVRTVDHHLAAIYAKLGVTTRSEAVAVALQAGIGSKGTEFKE